MSFNNIFLGKIVRMKIGRVWIQLKKKMRDYWKYSAYYSVPFSSTQLLETRVRFFNIICISHSLINLKTKKSLSFINLHT